MWAAFIRRLLPWIDEAFEIVTFFRGSLWHQGTAAAAVRLLCVFVSQDSRRDS